MSDKKVYKIGLHSHSTRSDGLLSYEDVINFYEEKGYDVLAVTDHWVWNEGDENGEMKILSGAEFNIGGADGSSGVYHILGICCDGRPYCRESDPPQDIIDKIHEKNGIAILAHPAWSLNTPEMLKKLNGIDMIEIYNSVSGVHESERPYSGLIIDMLAGMGTITPIHAADDSHYYDGTDAGIAYVMAYADSDSKEDIVKALKNGDFYSTMGPSLDIKKRDDGSIVIHTSPVSKIAIYSNLVWANDHVKHGDGITEMIYTPKHGERFVRCEAVDHLGKTAYSNIITL